MIKRRYETDLNLTQDKQFRTKLYNATHTTSVGKSRSGETYSLFSVGIQQEDMLRRASVIYNYEEPRARIVVEGDEKAVAYIVKLMHDFQKQESLTWRRVPTSNGRTTNNQQPLTDRIKTD